MKVIVFRMCGGKSWMLGPKNEVRVVVVAKTDMTNANVGASGVAFAINNGKIYKKSALIVGSNGWRTWWNGGQPVNRHTPTQKEQIFGMRTIFRTTQFLAVIFKHSECKESKHISQLWR
ncbi:uncharacterized protein LOC131997945 [Stomoxys calcitrans]|uniref:uncharacterized protein LOC131997945 n=1 Tax=Stomoxys calcitrans TaxID=35570 RepID=UPI0027E3524A|nr:uncharacterized protein LOC131997945 [Stomoxys calcitrans]